MQWQLFLMFFFAVRAATIEDCDPESFYKCETAVKCISHIFVCDGEDDCGDASDESLELCQNEIPSFTEVCKPYEYRCIDRSRCISEKEYCDGKMDCADGSDELENCNRNKTCDRFKCKSGYCIQENWVCDGIEDCNDGSDELNCPKNHAIPSSHCNNTIDKYLCDNERCIDLELACNSIDNCGDGSDENSKTCSSDCRYQISCSQKCRSTPTGAQCACESGYFLKSDQYSCEDINECKQYGICDQSCTNTKGSYECQCEIGYKLAENGHSCNPTDGEALVFFASKKSIRGYYLDSRIHFSVAEELHDVVGLAFNSKYMYCTEFQIGKGMIFRSLADGTKREAIVTSGIGMADNVAIDWITGNIYFTDSTNKRIGVCNENGVYCALLVSENVDKPRGISLLPFKGKMYWSDWGKNPHISVSSMDGSNAQFFIEDNIFWPNGLSIDYVNERLYWVDAKLKVIESVQLDGEDRRTVLHDLARHPYSMAIFGNRMYWSDWNTNSIESCNKFTCENIETISKSNETLYGLHIYHSILNKKSNNPCASNPCSDLCLLAENQTYSCACPLDKELNSDKHTCKHKTEQKYLVIATGNAIINYYRELLGKPSVTFNINIGQISTLTYDPLTDTLIVGDGYTKELYRYDAYTGDFNDIKPIAEEIDGCIAFDYIGGNLYKSSPTNKKIQVQNLDTGMQTEFSYDDSPHDLIVIPEEGVLFVVFQSEINDTSYHITRLSMDCTNEEAFVIAKYLEGPKVSIAYDETENRVFWADESTGSIWSVDIQGQDKKLLRSGITSPVSIAIIDTEIFWTSRNSTQLYWTNKKRMVSRIKSLNLPTGEHSEISLLQVIGGKKINYTHPCHINNGNCSHVCLVTNLDKARCACPSDLIIDANEKICRVKGSCANNEMKCSIDEKCIKKIQRCDGINDCEDGEDEMQCNDASFPNKFAEFTYRNGRLFIKTDNATVYILDGP